MVKQQGDQQWRDQGNAHQGRKQLVAIANAQPQAPGCLAGQQPCIKPFGPRHAFAVGAGAHRLIADDAPVFADRCHEGIDPVVVAGLGAVLDQPVPALAGLELLPEIGEGRRRHVRVAHDVVAAADEFMARKAADFDEGVVCRGDDALEVGGGDEGGVVSEFPFVIGDRHVDLHADGLRCSLSIYPYCEGRQTGVARPSFVLWRTIAEGRKASYSPQNG